jgi:hypothetical protein
MNLQYLFETIYQKNIWNNPESVSGAGSTIQATQSLRQTLRDFIIQNNIKSIFDAGCGDFNWMKEVTKDLDITYIGVDIVSELVALNNRKYSNDKIHFYWGSIDEYEIPKVDLIICRDVLVHLPFLIGKKILDRFVNSKSLYLLSTTFPSFSNNIDTSIDDVNSWRKINLCLPPYSLSDPFMVCEETIVIDDDTKHKRYAIWSLSNPKINFNKPEISVLINIKNRSKINFEGEERILFPNCIKSITDSIRRVNFQNKVEVIIMDWYSDDMPLEEWIYDVTQGIDLKIQKQMGAFNRGGGKNLLAIMAEGDKLCFIDSDMLVPPELFVMCDAFLKGEVGIIFPTCRYVERNGNICAFNPFGFGNMYLTKEIYNQIGGFEEDKTWGYEDIKFKQKADALGIKYKQIDVEGFLHQWHPNNTKWKDQYCG